MAFSRACLKTPRDVCYNGAEQESFTTALSQQALFLPSPLPVSLPWLSPIFVFAQALQARRAKCEHQNWDPLVWTSHRVIKWIKDIDLKVGGRSVVTALFYSPEKQSETTSQNNHSLVELMQK